PRLLDLGGGTGRLALPLAEQGCRVTLVDASAAALADAAAALATTDLDVTLGLGSAYDVGELPSGSFDAALSIEVCCYLEEPGSAVAELARVLRPGGIACVSVEAWPGGLLAARGLDPDELARALDGRVLHRPDDLFVRYFDSRALEALLVDAGLEPVALVSHHHVLEGPWSATLDPERALTPADRAALLALEGRLAADPALGSCGRGWLAVARKH
ncbi:MAG: class I SAM-dependent methyltransferase, partial [bacterium]